MSRRHRRTDSGSRPFARFAARRGPGATVRALGLIALVVLLAGCTPADEVGSPAQRVGTWVSSTQMGQAVGAVLGDAARVAAAVRAHQGTGVIHTDCAVLLQDTEVANGNLPSPDERLTTLLSDGYETEGTAANNCYTAGATNRALLAKSIREMSSARADFEQALARVTSLTGHPVSTTTTTQPADGGIFG